MVPTCRFFGLLSLMSLSVLDVRTGFNLGCGSVSIYNGFSVGNEWVWLKYILQILCKCFGFGFGFVPFTTNPFIFMWSFDAFCSPPQVFCSWSQCWYRFKICLCFSLEYFWSIILSFWVAVLYLVLLVRYLFVAKVFLVFFFLWYLLILLCYISFYSLFSHCWHSTPGCFLNDIFKSVCAFFNWFCSLRRKFYSYLLSISIRSIPNDITTLSEYSYSILPILIILSVPEIMPSVSICMYNF